MHRFSVKASKMPSMLIPCLNTPIPILSINVCVGDLILYTRQNSIRAFENNIRSFECYLFYIKKLLYDLLVYCVHGHRL